MDNIEISWRKTYEGYSLLGWLGCGAALTYAKVAEGMPTSAYVFMLGATGLLAGYNGLSAWNNLRKTISLGGKGISFIGIKQLQDKVAEAKNEMWLGWGFDWGNQHTQRLYELKKSDPERYYAPKWVMKLYQKLTGQQIGSITPGYVGAPWLHGIEMKEENLRISVENFIGNTLILGTTRCGKSRMIEIIAAQAIEMGHTVIVLDPKGDQPMEASIREAAKRSGREDDLVRVHLGFPSDSIRIDLLKNFTNPSDLATRISSLMPGGDQSSSFRDFAWGVLNAIVIGMLYMGEKPTLVRIRSYVENGVNDLLLRSLLRFMDKKLPAGWEEEVLAYALTLPNKKGKSNEAGEMDARTVRVSLGLLWNYYNERLRHQGLREECLESLATIYTHDSAHYGKMIANLLPVLAMLTTGDLAAMLSPDATDINDPRPITDNQALIRSRAILYFGLDSLANKTVSSAVGSMFLSDMTSVAANIYKYEPDRSKKEKIFLIVDESVEVVNDPYIAMLNKSAGAGFVNIAAAQTVPDFEARFDDAAKALQMLGNFNNLLALRVKDGRTQEYVVETFGEVFISTKQTTFASSSSTDKAVTEFSGSVNERVSETLSALIPPDVLGEIPNWQYIGAVSGGRIIKGRLPIIRHEEVLGSITRH